MQSGRVQHRGCTRKYYKHTDERVLPKKRQGETIQYRCHNNPYDERSDHSFLYQAQLSKPAEQLVSIDVS
jgi:hypothetical protein